MIQAEKNELKTDKERLLDFIEQNDRKFKKEEDSLKQSESDALRFKCDFEYIKRKFDELTKQKLNQDELMLQAKLNLQDMREQKEGLNGEVTGLKRSLDIINENLKKTQE